MAHGWDPYFQNHSPLSPNPGTLRRKSESERSLSQHVENFTGHQDFGSAEASHEDHATTSNFNTNSYLNTNIGNSSSDCVYQGYYEETQWQTNVEQMEKEYLPQCGNSNLSNFATEGLSTSASFPSALATDLQGIKQDCGIVATSFLEDYSDVSSCSDADVSETRPSCKFMANSSVKRLKTDVATKHSLPEWVFSQRRNVMCPTESPFPNMSQNNVILPTLSNVKTKENTVKCAEKSVKSSAGHSQSSNTSNVVLTISSETVQSRNTINCFEYQKQQNNMDRALTPETHSNMTISGYTNQMQSNESEDYLGGILKDEITAITPSILTKFTKDPDYIDEKTLRNEIEESLSQKNEGFGNLKSADGQETNVTQNVTDTTKLLQKGRLEYNAFDQQKCLIPTFMSSQDQKIVSESKETRLNTSHTKGLLGIQVPEYKEASQKPQNFNSPLKHKLDIDSCSQSVAFNTGVNPCPEENWRSTGVKTVFTFPSPDCNGGTTDNLFTDISDIKEQSIVDPQKIALQADGPRAVVKPDLEQDLKDQSTMRNTTSSTDQEDISSALTRNKNEPSVYILARSHLHPESLSAGTISCVDKEMTSMIKDETTSSSTDPDCSGPGVSIETLSLDTSNQYKQSDAEPDIGLQTHNPSTNVNLCLEKDCKRTKLKTSIFSPDPECNCPGATTDKNNLNVKIEILNHSQKEELTYQAAKLKDPSCNSFSCCSESCLEPNTSNGNGNPGLEINTSSKETTLSTENEKHRLNESPVAPEPQTLGQNISEDGRGTTELLETSLEEQLALGMLYGEPLSREESSCDSNDSKRNTSQYKETPETERNGSSMENSKGEELQLKLSEAMRKQLHPVVLLDALDSVNVLNDSYQCAICRQTTSSVDDLIKHHHSDHLVQKFQFCKTCDLYLIRSEEAEKHLCGVNKESPKIPSDSSLKRKKCRGKHKCNRCEIVFPKFVQYVRHMRIHTGKTPYRCKKCGVYFAQGSTLRRHLRISGRCKQLNEVIKSDVSSKAATKPPHQDLAQNRDSLPECNLKLVDISKTNLCGLCGKYFLSAEETKKHVYNIHKRNSLADSPNQLSTKLNNEEPRKEEIDPRGKYKCPLCPRLFKYSYNRARHLRDCVRDSIYGGKQKVGGKYLCPLCHTTFTLSSNRYRHIKAFCLRQCLSRLAKHQSKSGQTVEQHKSNTFGQKICLKENEDRKTTKGNEQKKQASIHNADPRPLPRYKCSLCPAAFRHTSGKYKHMKKHELFKLTGKMFRYRISVFSTMSKPALANANNEKSKSNLNSTVTKSCHFCGKCFCTSQSLKKHERIHRGERPYCCLDCGRGFKKRAHLFAHKIVHQRRRIQCTVCRKILPTIGELIQHRNSHLKRGMLQCPDCHLQFQYPAHLLRHLDAHRNRENKASQLEEGKRSQQQQQGKSVEKEAGSNQVQCSLCKETFNDAQVLRKHCLTHISGSSSNQCPFCKHNFNNRRYLLRHMIKHTGDKPYSCENCGKQFYRDLYLKLHYESCSPAQVRRPVPVESPTKTKRPHHCSYCPRSFCKKTRLKNHHHGHKANTLLLCSRCGQYFGYTKISQHQKNCEETENSIAKSPNKKETPQTNLNVQKISVKANSSNVLQFKCPYCTQRFRYRSLLLRHLVSHTGLQPYACMHCGHRYGTQTMCLQHEAFCDGVYKEGLSKVNSNAAAKVSSMSAFREATPKPQAEHEPEYKCKFCTKTFVKSRNLRHHILTHNEVKPYRCKTCESCFSRYDHLKVHQTRCHGKKQRLEVCIPKISLADVGRGWQIRFGIEPTKKQESFECKECLRSFPTQSELSRHVTMFHVTKLFKCTRCGSSFAHKKTLKKHRKIKRCRRVSNEPSSLQTGPHLLRENPTIPVQSVKSRILHRIKPFYNKKFKYACSYCPRTFRNSWQLGVHTRLHTGEKPFRCEYCGQRFIRKDYLQRHFPKCTKKQLNQVVCDGCGGFFPQIELENHKMNCTVVPNMSEAKAYRDEQTVSQSPPKGFSCANCNSRFLLFSHLQEHFLNAHKLETAVVPLSSTASLQHHLSNIPNIKEEPLDESYDEQHSEDATLTCKLDADVNVEVANEFFCQECSTSFGSKSGLTAHLRGHAANYPFNCKTCQKGFWNKTLLRNHYRKCRYGPTSENNSNQKLEIPVKAEIDFVFSDPALVLEETSKTTGNAVLQTNFSCKDESMDKYSQESEDISDESSSSKDKKAVQYQCSECDKSFTDGLLLISHLEDHGREELEKKRNTCSKCGRVCNSQSSLDKHLKMHGSDKKRPCPDCSRIAYSSSDVKIPRTCPHLHRPYTCKICNQRFWTRSSLCNHYGKDHPDNAFFCRFCNKAYSVKKSLTRHLKKWHPKEQRDVGGISQGCGNMEKQSASQASTTGESDEGENNDSGESESDSAPFFPCHVCGKTFPTSESLEDHQRCHLGEKPHECEECGKCFFQASQLQQHQRMHKSEFQCQACGRGFVSLFALRKHKHTHGKSRPYRCSKCHFSFTGPSQLAEHMSTHLEENFPCDICNHVFLSKSSRAEHRKSHSKSDDQNSPSVLREEQEKSPSPPESSSLFTKELKYRCGVCSERFRDPEELSEHGCMAAKERPYSCSDCKKHFLHASHLKKHKATHQPLLSSSEYACNKCNKSFSSSQQFLSHLENHVETGSVNLNLEEGDEGSSHDFICPVCNECFATAAVLSCHFPTHLDGTVEHRICKKADPCGSKLCEDEKHPTSAAKFECTKLSISNCHQAGEDEEVDVTGEDLHNCPHCSRQFSSKSSLLNHQNKQHSKLKREKPFECELCGKTFALRRYLKEHERRHQSKVTTQNTTQSPEKKFKCIQCHTRFSSTKDLSVHMRQHAEKDVGEFRCDMCYKSFSHWHLLKVHQESHVGEVVYECTECDKAFAFPHLLEEHQQTHAGTSQ